MRDTAALEASLGLIRACVQQGLDEQKKSRWLGIWMGMERRKKEKVAPGCSPELLTNQQIRHIYPSSHPVKALLVAPSGHLCEHRSWEEATGLHIGRDLLQAL